MPELRLAGCRSRPLIGYLKALGILRIVARQADGSARARWRDGTFELRSRFDEDQLARFLLDDYSPSPVLSPWNGRSGFYLRGGSAASGALARIQQAKIPRLAPYRGVIEQTRAMLDDLGLKEKPSSDVQKAELVRRLRRCWPDDAIEWLDAAIVLTGSKAAFPPLLGSGGNDGSYDFSSNFMQSLCRTLLGEDADASRPLLHASLLGTASPMEKMAVAHFSRDASPTNSPHGEADSLGNPWDLTLAVEGTLLLVAGAARRHGAAAGSALVAPFTVYSTAAGYGSAVSGETGRAEIWLPLWSGWATHAEIATLVRESRAQVGSGHSSRQASSGLDFARAAGALGVARGIEAFERYAILERAGQSSLAVPAGRVLVSERRGAEAIESIDRLLGEVVRFSRDDRCPTAIRVLAGRLERASFQLASRGARKDACDTLEAMGALEHALARSRYPVEAGIHPVHGVPAAPWIKAADDGTQELAVAVALASLRDRRLRSPALRDYLHGTRDGGSGFDANRGHVVEGNGAARLLAAIHARRHLDVGRGKATEGDDERLDPDSERRLTSDASSDHFSLRFDEGARCDVRIARLFMAGRLDDDRILRLLWGMALLDHWAQAPVPRGPARDEVATPIFDILALAWTGTPRPQRLGDAGARLGPRPGWAARLAAGAIDSVVRDSLLRLRMAGLAPIAGADDLLSSAPFGAHLGPRLGAALLIRLGRTDIDRMAHKLTIPERSGDENEMKETA
ncbi:MAG: type I-U CRISPR-associated protein Csx17 [Actinomycetota bacterium]|nr:type I-U CRISPR-associated protein Csx17 [Actinomycetota bacterium]